MVGIPEMLRLAARNSNTEKHSLVTVSICGRPMDELLNAAADEIERLTRLVGAWTGAALSPVQEEPEAPELLAIALRVLPYCLRQCGGDPVTAGQEAWHKAKLIADEWGKQLGPNRC